MLVIDNVNYDAKIDESTYSASLVDEYGGTEYVDGWWVKHRSVVRRRVSASIDLCFNNATEYNTFVSSMMSGLDADGAHSVEVYVNDTNAISYIQAYITWSTKTALATKAYDNVPVFWRVTLTIEER